MADFFSEIGHLFLLHKQHQRQSCNFIPFIGVLPFVAYQMFPITQHESITSGVIFFSVI